eukprot:49610-Prymnesium_polylepis.1
MSRTYVIRAVHPIIPIHVPVTSHLKLVSVVAALAALGSAQQRRRAARVSHVGRQCHGPQHHPRRGAGAPRHEDHSRRAVVRRCARQ